MKKIYSSGLKRVIDILVVILLFFFLIPALLIIVITYLFLVEFPIIYQQRRIGKDGMVFTLLKFRTLNNESHESLQQRRFAWGDFLRKFSLDELPQLWNVFKGEMSLIGPRPLPVEYVNLFSKEQWKRHLVRPGITGWAQVNGRNSISWKQKFGYDLFYIQNISFWLDIKIFYATLVLIFSSRKDVSLQEEKFTGSK